MWRAPSHAVSPRLLFPARVTQPGAIVGAVAARALAIAANAFAKPPDNIVTRQATDVSWCVYSTADMCSNDRAALARHWLRLLSVEFAPPAMGCIPHRD